MQPQQKARLGGLSIAAVIVVIVVLILVMKSFVIVDVGHTAVSTLFGKPSPEPYDQGLHFPVNPLRKFISYDVRQKTLMENARVPSQDQLTTEMDVSVQYRVNPAMVPRILAETGLQEDLINVHLVPKLRSVIREQGRTVEKAEFFFKEETQVRLQDGVLTSLQAYCGPKGIEIEAVLIRDVKLPDFIVTAIEEKKQREQEVEKQKNELERFRTEQEQIVVQAEAEKAAAEAEAEMRRLLADAKAYEIESINEAMAESEYYVQLQALETLQIMSQNPAVQLYFMNGEAQMPLPLMNIGAAARQVTDDR
jgi:regulator of protease activity HflC (stomatin/prohibitin superfamily)